MQANTPPRRDRSLRSWVHNHDDSWIFIAGYIGLAIVLSTWISLFWLAAVVGVHFVFEWLRQSHLRAGIGGVLPQVLWELKLDIALVLFALVMALYLDTVLGLAGLGAATRMAAAGRVGAVARAGVRFSGLERGLRGIILSADDVAQALRAFFRRRPSGGPAAGSLPKAAAPARRTGGLALADRWGSWALPWKRGDWIVIAFGLACVPLILAAPLLTPHTPQTALAVLALELHPLPARD